MNIAERTPPAWANEAASRICGNAVLQRVAPEDWTDADAKLAAIEIAAARQVTRQPADPNAPTVVNVKTGEEWDTYIGRAVRMAKDRRLRQTSVYANPYRIGKPDPTDPIGQPRARAGALAAYEGLWRGRLAGNRRHHWLKHLTALTGKRLGCWCAPEPCHGHVLRELWLEFVAQATPEIHEGAHGPDSHAPSVTEA